MINNTTYKTVKMSVVSNDNGNWVQKGNTFSFYIKYSYFTPQDFRNLIQWCKENIIVDFNSTTNPWWVYRVLSYNKFKNVVDISSLNEDELNTVDSKNDFYGYGIVWFAITIPRSEDQLLFKLVWVT